MDDKTEELRDIFVDVAGEDAVTESQEESPGSLTTDEDGVDDRIVAVIERMDDRYQFATELGTEALVTVVRGFYDGDDDETIAADLSDDAAADVDPAGAATDDAAAIDVTTDDVFRARMDLHLFRDADTEAPFDLAPLRKRPDVDVETLAAELDVSPDEIRHYRRVVDAQTEARQVSQRFQSEFEEALADAGLSTMTDAMPENGRTDATEDIDSLEEDADVSF